MSGYIYEGKNTMDSVIIKETQGDGCVIRTYAGNDVISVKAGKNHYIDMGVGNDRITIESLVVNSVLNIDQTSAGNNDNDNLILSKYNASEFEVYFTNGRDLHLRNSSSNAEIVITDWLNHALSYITFKDKRCNVRELAYTFGVNNYDLALKGQYLFQGNNTVVAHDSTIIVANRESTINLNGSNNNVEIKSGTANLNGGTVNNVFGSSGSDSVYINGAAVDSVDLGSGDDVIVVNSGFVGRIKGGLGSDTYIIGNLDNGHNYIVDQNGQRNSGDSDCLILDNYDHSNFSVNITDNGNFILTNDNSKATITVENWGNNALSSICFRDTTLTAAMMEEMIAANSGPVTQQSVILDFMDSLDHTMLYGTNALNEAVVSCSKGLYSSAQNLIDNFIYDAVHYGSSSTDGQKSFLLNYCGIDLDNADTGAITGLDAGGLIEKNNNSVVAEPVGMSLNNLVYNYTDTITAQDYFTGQTKQFTCATVNYKGEDITLYWDEASMQSLVNNGYINNMNVLKKMMSGIVEAWVPAAFELIDESYGMSFADDTSVLKTLSNGNKGMQVCLDYASSSVRSSYTGSSSYSWLAAVANSPTISYVNGGKITTEAKEALLINTNYFKNGVADINGNPAVGSSSSQTLDRVIAHEMVHGVMAANINAVNNLPLFLKEGLAELVQGVDDSRRSELLSISNTDKTFYASSGTYNQQQVLEKMLDLDHPTYSLSTYSYATGYALLRYMAKQVEDSVGSGDVSFTLDSGNLRDYEIDFMEGGLDLGPSYGESWIDYSTKDAIQVFGSN